jgi:hypothetical protein
MDPVLDPDGSIRLARRERPTPVDALFDGAGALFVHGGRQPHARLVEQLVSQEFASRGATLVFRRPSRLGEPVLRAVVDSFHGRMPGERLRPRDRSVLSISVRLRTADDVRANVTGQHVHQLGEDVKVQAILPHAELVVGMPARFVALTIDEYWAIALASPLVPAGYFTLIKRIEQWQAAGAWMLTLDQLVREGLEARRGSPASTRDLALASAQTADGLTTLLGNRISTTASESERALLITLTANAVARLIPRATKLPQGSAVQLTAEAKAFIEDRERVSGRSLTLAQRSALVRAIWRLVTDAGEDLLALLHSIDALSRS